MFYAISNNKNECYCGKYRKGDGVFATFSNDDYKTYKSRKRAENAMKELKQECANCGNGEFCYKLRIVEVLKIG